MKFLDAHHHFWDIDSNYHPWLCDELQIPFRYGNYDAIRKNYLPIDYAEDTADVEVVGSVHVEAEWNTDDPVGETRWLADITQACNHPVVFVVQARLDQEDIEDVLSAHSVYRQTRGIRQKPLATEQTSSRQRGLPGSMDDPKWRDGYAYLDRFGYSFDLQTPSNRNDVGISAWSDAIEKIARQPNVMIKISGLGRINQPWTIESNRGIVLRTLDIFGTDRCMFASNFPVDRLCGDFGTIIQGFREIVKTLPENKISALFHGNAARIYRFNQ